MYQLQHYGVLENCSSMLPNAPSFHYFEAGQNRNISSVIFQYVSLKNKDTKLNPNTLYYSPHN